MSERSTGCSSGFWCRCMAGRPLEASNVRCTLDCGPQFALSCHVWRQQPLRRKQDEQLFHSLPGALQCGNGYSAELPWTLNWFPLWLVVRAVSACCFISCMVNSLYFLMCLCTLLLMVVAKYALLCMLVLCSIHFSTMMTPCGVVCYRFMCISMC